MANSNSKTQRIIKNTFALYVRMAVTMLISLYTSRVVLKELGLDDFGIFSAVGGFVSVFSFLKSSMSSSTQRFLSFEMGKGNSENLGKIFSVCVTAHIILALILVVIAETVGLWFVNTQMNIPDSRMVAANWIYQFSVISLFISIIYIPYTADIISNEKMGYFALLGIVEAVLKLVVAYLIVTSPFDKLIYYGALILLTTIINTAMTWIYCRVKFKESHYHFVWDVDSFKKVFSFSGWTVWGQLAVVGSNQGTGVLANIFFSVKANAAIGVGHQVNGALSGLVSNFQSAYKPQIIKSYAEGDYSYLNSLIRYSSKLSFLLLFLVSLPIIANIDLVLNLWLVSVPPYAGELCIIYIIATLCDALSGPLWMSVFATGRIKNYQLAISAFYLCELVIVYALFKLGLPLVVGISMKALLNFSVIFVRAYFAKKQIEEFDYKSFFGKTIVPLLSICMLSYVAIAIIMPLVNAMLFRVLLTCVIELFALTLSLFLGMNKSERMACKKLILKK